MRTKCRGRLRDKVVVVTGGASGLGAAFVRALAAEGARAVVADQDLAAATALAEKTGGGASAVHLDVADEASWERLAALVPAEHGRWDGLVNNAGIVRRGAVVETTLEEFRSVLDVNLTGTFLGMRSCAPLMRQAGGGAIVNVASVAGMTGVPGITGYTASKWGVRGLTRAAAVELAPWGIRVNTLAPGVISTPMAARSAAGTHNLRGTPGEVDEVSPWVVQLLADDGAHCTGTEIVVDGGETATSRLPAELPAHRSAST